MKITNSLKNAILDIVFNYINPDESLVFLFGSYATGEARVSSDIDIGLMCQKDIPDNLFARLRLKLAEDVQTLRQIQVFDFAKASEDFKDMVMKEIKIWYRGKNFSREML